MTFDLTPSRNTSPPTTPTPPSSHRQPNHSYPCPPHPADPQEDRERGDRGGKIKHTPGMYQHTNMASAQALRSAPLLFLQDVWGPALVTRPDANHRISDISLRPHPGTTSTPPLRSRWECFVKTQRRRARPVVLSMKQGQRGCEAPAPGPRGPLGASSAPSGAAPLRAPVGSDGWESFPWSSTSEMDEFCLS